MTISISGSGLFGAMENIRLGIYFVLLFRFLQGVVNLYASKCISECCKTYFQGHFKLVQGLALGGWFLNGAVANLIGGVAYDHFKSFTIPFMIFGILNCMILVINMRFLPSKEVPVDNLSDKPDLEEEPESENHELDDPKGLHIAIALPLLVGSILDLLYGYTTTIIVPYLLENFDISVAKGGVYVMVLHIGMASGCFIAGTMEQHKIISSSMIMVISSIIGSSGIFLLFPNTLLHSALLYGSIPYTAYPAVFLIGLSSQLGSVSGLQGMEDVQIMIAKRKFGFYNRSTVQSLYFSLQLASSSTGAMLSVVVRNNFTFAIGAIFLLGSMLVSFAVGFVIFIGINRKVVRQRGKEYESLA